MKIFNLKGEKLETVYSFDFSLESEIQKITEDNLLEVFDLELVKSEFTIQNFRVDTLAFDRKTNSFVIIEYKRSKNYSVVDQGSAYFALMLANKSDLILEYMENSNNKIKRKSINWNDSKILFVSPEFTNYQKEAINFKDLPIELWEIKRYNNNTVSYFRIGGEDRNTQLKSNRNGKRDVLEPNKVNTLNGVVTSEIVSGIEGFAKTYEEKNKNYVNKNIWNLYEKIKESILSIDNVNIENKKTILNFMANNKVFASVLFRKSSLIIFLNLKWGELSDPKQIARDVSVSNVRKSSSGDYEIKINSDDNIDYIIELIKFSYYDTMGLNDEDDFSIKEDPILINTNKMDKIEFIPSNYNLDWVSRKSSDLTLKLYNQLINELSRIGNIKIKYNKFVSALFINKNKFSDITIWRKSIDIQLNLKAGSLNDPLLMTRDVSNVGTYGTGDYMISIKDNEDMDYVIDLIKQSYLFAKNK